MEYHVVPAPTMITVSGERNFAKVAKAYEDIIAREAAQGWNFIAIDTTTLQQTSCGCNTGNPTTLKIIVFGR